MVVQLIQVDRGASESFLTFSLLQNTHLFQLCLFLHADVMPSAVDLVSVHVLALFVLVLGANGVCISVSCLNALIRGWHQLDRAGGDAVSIDLFC